MGEFTERRRLDGLTELIGVTEVRRLLGCKLSLAYEHLRRAAGRQPGERGLLRVTKAVWERYALREFNMSDSTIRLRPDPPRHGHRSRLARGAGRTGVSTTKRPGEPPIPVTRPRRSSEARAPAKTPSLVSAPTHGPKETP